MNKAFIYLGANILSAIVPFILIPVLTQNITTYEYGQLSMFMVLVAAFSSVIGFSSTGAANREYFESDATKEYLTKYNTSCFYIMIVSFVILLMLILCLKDILVKRLEIPLWWLILALSSSVFSYILAFRLGQYQVRELAIKYAFLQILFVTINLVATSYFIFCSSLGAEGRVVAILMSNILCAFFSIVSMWRENIIGFCMPSRCNMKNILSFGLPIVPHSVALLVINSVDKIIVGNFIGYDELGVYTLAIQISSGICLVGDAINKTISPWIFRKLQCREYGTIVRKLYIIAFFLFLVSMLSIFVSPYVVVILAGDAYSESSALIPVLVFAQSFFVMYLILSNFIFYERKTSLISYVTIFVSILNVIVLIPAAKEYGLIGVSYVFLLSKLLQFLLTLFLAQRITKFSWERVV